MFLLILLGMFFDVDELNSEYKTQSFEDVFPRAQTVEYEGMPLIIISDFGEDVLKIDENLIANFHYTKMKLLENLQLVKGIGPKYEEVYKQQGILDLDLLKKCAPQYFEQINGLKTSIDTQDIQQLQVNRQIRDIDILFCFSPTDLLFFDIETTDLRDGTIFLVGLGYFTYEEKGLQFHVDQLLCQDANSEGALLFYLREFMPKFKVLIGYNLKTFDIPFLDKQFFMWDIDSPLTDQTIPRDKKVSEYCTEFVQLDLYHEVRRNFKENLSNFKLTTVEEELLGLPRVQDIKGQKLGEYWENWQEDPQNWLGALRQIVLHNYLDIFSLPEIMELVLQCRYKDYL